MVRRLPLPELLKHGSGGDGAEPEAVGVLVLEGGSALSPRRGRSSHLVIALVAFTLCALCLSLLVAGS